MMLRFAFVIFAMTLLAAPAQAEENYYNVDKSAEKSETAEKAEPSGGTIVVTSIGKCFDKLGPEEALEIRRNFVKPYEECQRRLALKVKKEQHLKVGDSKKKKKEKANEDDGADKEDIKDNADAPDAENTDDSQPRGFFRVQKTPFAKKGDANDLKRKTPAYNP